MESLDNLLFSSGPNQGPKPGFSKKVMGKLAWQRLRRNLLIITGLGTILTGILMLRSHVGLILGYAVSKTTIVMAHPTLFVRALAESIPLPLAIGILATLVMMIFVRRAFGLLATARVTGALTTASFLMVGSTAAFASSTSSAGFGPAQQQLRLIVNGIGRPSVQIGGVTYQFATNVKLSESQLQAFAEFKRTADIATEADRVQGIPDLYVTGLAEITVKNITENELTYVYTDSYITSQKDQKVAITPKTIFLNGGQKSTSASIKQGDLVLLNSFSGGSALVIGRLNYPLRDYGTFDYTTTPLAHRTDGRCFENNNEKCPNIPAAYTMFDFSDVYSIPNQSKYSPIIGKQLIEVYGTITQITPTQVMLKASDGAIWTMNLGLVIKDANTLKLEIKHGDHLRVEVYTSALDRQTHVLHDLSLDPGRTMELDYDEASGSVFNVVQLPLKKVWHYGQTAEKL